MSRTGNAALGRRGAVAVAAVATAAGLLALGRATAVGSGPQDGTDAGRTAGYAAGLQAGEQLGLAEGRALQEGAALPAAARQPVRDAFSAGYAAGAADVFSGYDGGWLLSTPYVVTLVPGQGAVPYRIASRTQLAPGTTYRLCQDATSVCTVPSG